MTPEVFRKWIIILFAVSIVTVWVSMGARLCNVSKYQMGYNKMPAMMKEMPQTMPKRATMPVPKRVTPPAASKQAPAQSTAVKK